MNSIFVDNGSTDGTVDYLKSLAGVTVIENSENRGFPAAANQGIAAATGQSGVAVEQRYHRDHRLASPPAYDDQE